MSFDSAVFLAERLAAGGPVGDATSAALVKARLSARPAAPLHPEQVIAAALSNAPIDRELAEQIAAARASLETKFKKKTKRVEHTTSYEGDEKPDDEENGEPEAGPKKTKAGATVPGARVFVPMPSDEELEPPRAWGLQDAASQFAAKTGIPTGFLEAATRSAIKCGIPHDATMTCHQDGRVTWTRR